MSYKLPGKTIIRNRKRLLDVRIFDAHGKIVEMMRNRADIHFFIRQESSILMIIISYSLAVL